MIRHNAVKSAALIGLALWLQPNLQAQISSKTNKPGMLFYEPGPNNPAADVWGFKKGALWYVYTLNGHGQDSIGVAVSKDLMLFENRGVAIPSVSGTWESSHYGGDTFTWKGRYYMLYSAPGPGMANAIGLAESEDLLHWKKHSGNPVMRHPDARWYEGATQDGMRGGISCRDVSAIEDAFTDEWAYACFTASTGRGDYYRRGCIGLARSKNLTDWEYLPPLFAPGLYTALEVPRVCRIGSKWFLTWLHAPWYGIRTDEDYGQRAYSWAETMIHYAVADKPLGPYRLPEDPTLFRGNASPYVIDLVPDAGQVLVMTTMFKQQGAKLEDRERCGLMPAMPIRQAKDNPDRLEVGFPEKLRGYFPDPLAVIELLRINNPLPELQDVAKEGNRIAFSKTSNRLVELTEPTKADFLIDVDFEVASGRVGLATRYNREARKGCVILVDPKRKELQFAELKPIYERGIILHVLERHNITAPVGSDFRLSVIHSRDYQLVFVNDVLAATFSFPRRDAGVVGLFLENATGKCVVGGIQARPDPDEVLTNHAARNRPVSLAHPYHASFTAGGGGALTDGRRGRTGPSLSEHWQGFAGVDLDATVDLGQVTTIRSLESTYLQHIAGGIFLPTTVKYLVSLDGRQFDVVATVAGDVPPLAEPGPVIRPFAATLAGVPARYVRVQAASLRTIPAGHPAAGLEAWLFVDEILVNPPEAPKNSQAASQPDPAAPLTAVLASGDAPVAEGRPPVDKDGRPLIQKRGTIDLAVFAENSLIMFKGKLYSLRWLGDMKDFYFQFEEYESGKKMSPFARGYAYGRSFVEGDTVYVSSTIGIRREEMTKVYLHSSKDMVHWQTREILDQPGWFIFTSPMCKADNRYVMMHDVYGAPSEGRAGGTFCRFSTSDDMAHWKMTPPECWYSRNGFAAGHFLAYLEGSFYNFYMGEIPANKGWEMRVARSKDLIRWEDSPLNPVLRASEELAPVGHLVHSSAR